MKPGDGRRAEGGQGKDGTTLGVIVAQDDADQRLTLKWILHKAGYMVREARNGREALALQRAQPAAILIADLFMPEIDGIELIGKFKREFPATKIVVVSGGSARASGDYPASARLAGADVALEKPIDIRGLLRILRELSG